MKVILIAAALAAGVSGANACEFARSASAKVDNMTVASTMVDLSTPQTAIPSERVKDDSVELNG